MNAKCPHCKSGCDECDGTGMIQVSFASGDVFTRHCLACGENNGGRIVEGFPPEPSGPCVWCGGETEWVFLGRAE